MKLPKFYNSRDLYSGQKRYKRKEKTQNLHNSIAHCPTTYANHKLTSLGCGKHTDCSKRTSCSQNRLSHLQLTVFSTTPAGKRHPQAAGFTDERTERPAKNQSVGRVVYTDTAIYVGLQLYDDMPDKIVARQTKDQTRIRGEDWVSFSLDPFHTHQFSDRNFFIVNPLGTKFATPCYWTCREK